MDMMSEMAKRLQARKQRAEGGGGTGGSNAPAAPPPSTESEPVVGGGGGQFEPPFGKTKAPGFTPLKKLPGTPAPPPAPSESSNISTASVRPPTTGPGLDSSTVSSADLETLKQEILVEVFREMHKIKDEIIEAIRAELSKR